MLLCLFHGFAGINKSGSPPSTYGSGTNLGEGVVVDLSYSYPNVPAPHAHRKTNSGACGFSVLQQTLNFVPHSPLETGNGLHASKLV